MAIECKSNPEDPHAQAPEGRAFFVSVLDGDRQGILAGPYATHGEAMAAKREAKRLAHDADPKAPWYAFGTCQGPEDLPTVSRVGVVA